jgi:16S rRNA (guanine(966)-N(2))-methyltransferase RsmD
MTDRAREGLYSSLGERIAGARVLDLYAGSGAVGIEALSRGAASAVFVDRARESVAAVEENLRRTNLAGRARVVRSSVLGFLRARPEPFDLVLVDAPYPLPGRELDEVFHRLRSGWLPEERAWTVVLSRPPKGYMPVTPLHWRITKRLDYGDTHIHLYGEA